MQKFQWKLNRVKSRMERTGTQFRGPPIRP